MSKVTPKEDDYKGYLSLLRSKSLTMSATEDNGWTLDLKPIQKFNLDLIKDCVEELEKEHVADNELLEELAMRMLMTRLDWYNYVATGKLQDDFWGEHAEADRLEAMSNGEGKDL